MNAEPATATQAAAELGCTPTCIRQWVARGAPCVRRERPLLVNVAELRRWRAGERGEVLEEVAQALLDTLRRDCGTGQPAHAALGIDPRAAASLLLMAFERTHRALGREASKLPQAIRTLRQMAGLPPDPQ